MSGLSSFWSYYFAWYQGGVYGNLIASAITTTLVAVLTVLKVREHLAAHREHEAAEREAHRVAMHASLTEHHDVTRTHVTEQLAQHAAMQGEQMQVISDQLAALHARLEQQGGTP